MPSATELYTGRSGSMAGNGTEAGDRQSPAHQKEPRRALRKSEPALQRCLAASYGSDYSKLSKYFNNFSRFFD